jgi:hypothetical protein
VRWKTLYFPAFSGELQRLGGHLSREYRQWIAASDLPNKCPTWAQLSGVYSLLQAMRLPRKARRRRDLTVARHRPPVNRKRWAFPEVLRRHAGFGECTKRSYRPQLLAIRFSPRASGSCLTNPLVHRPLPCFAEAAPTARPRRVGELIRLGSGRQRRGSIGRARPLDEDGWLHGQSHAAIAGAC